MRSKTIVNLTLLIVFFLSLVGCGSGGGDDSTAPTIESLAISGLSDSYIESTQQEISVIATYSDGHSATISGISWSSNNSSVLNVSSTNMLIASQPGTAIITATLNDIEVSTSIDVIPATLTDIAISSPQSTIPLGLSISMDALGSFNNGLTNTIDAEFWQTSNSLVATVSSSGVVTTLSEGVVTISVIEGELQSNFALTVSEAELTGISISSGSYTLASGFNLSLVASGVYTDNQTILIESPEWYSDTTSILTVNNLGTVSGISTGSSQVTATVNGITSAPVTITVTNAVLVGFELNPSSVEVPLGLSETVSGIAIFSDNTRIDISPSSFQSNNPLILSVDNQGKVLGLDVGLGELEATYESFTDNISVTISDAVVVGLEISPSNALDIPLGVQQVLSAQAFYSDNSSQDVTESAQWSSTIGAITYPQANQPSYISNSLGNGYVQAQYLSFTAQTTVEAIAAIPLALSFVDLTDSSITSISSPLGLEEQLLLVVTYSDQTQLKPSNNVAWSVSDALVGNLSADGSETVAFTGLKLGNFSLKAAFSDLELSVPVEITAATPVSLLLSDQTVYLDDDVSLQGALTFSDGTVETVQDSLIWAIDDIEKATISNASGTEGKVNLLTRGEPLVTATFGSESISADMTLTILQPRLISGFKAFHPGASTIEIGEGDYAITLKFSQRDQNKVAFYNDSNSGISLVTGLNTIDQLTNTAANDFSLRFVDIENNSDHSIGVVRNSNNIYGVIQVHDVRDNGRDGNIDNIAFSWVIRTDGGSDFSAYQPESDFILLKCISGSIFDPSGCEPFALPFTETFSSNVSTTPIPASHSLGEYTLIALSNDIQVTDLLAQDLNGLVTPLFNNLADEQIISKGDGVPFTLTIPPTNNASTRPVYQLSIDNSVSNTFSVSGTFTSN